MNFRRLVSAVAALAVAGTCVVTSGVSVLAATSITSYVDTEKTDSTYYDSASGQIIFPTVNSTASSGSIYLSTPIDITGGDDGDTVTISFNMTYTTNGYNPLPSARRTMTFLASDSSQVMPVVDEYNWAHIYFGTASDTATALGSVTKVTDTTASGTECIITVRTNASGQRVAQMQIGTNYSDATVITGDEISTIQLTIGTSITQSSRGLYVNDFQVTTEAATATCAVTFDETTEANPSVTVYSDSERTTVVNPLALEANTRYYYTATVDGYFDYEDYFDIVEADYTESFAMTQKVAAGSVIVNYVDSTDTTKTLNSVYAYNAETATDDDAKYVGSSLTYYYPAYLDVNGTLYKSEASTYEGTVSSLTADGSTETVKYVAQDAEVYQYYEATDDTDPAESASYGKYFSNGKFHCLYDGTSTEVVTMFTVNESGVYTLTVNVGARSSANNTNYAIIYVNGVAQTTTLGMYLAGNGPTNPYTGLELHKGDTIGIGANNTRVSIDYALLVKTGDLTPSITVDNETATAATVDFGTGESATTAHLVGGTADDDITLTGEKDVYIIWVSVANSTSAPAVLITDSTGETELGKSSAIYADNTSTSTTDGYYCVQILADDVDSGSLVTFSLDGAEPVTVILN